MSYRQLRIKNAKSSIRQVQGKRALGKGLWVPVSVASHLTGFSTQRIRLKIFNSEINAIRFPVGPILVDIHSLK